MAGCASVQGQLVGMGCELNLIFSASILCLFIPSFIAKLFRLLEISGLVALRQQGFIQVCVTLPGFMLDTAMAIFVVIPADEAYLPVVAPR